MYDADNDELISKDELLGVLQMMVGDNIRSGPSNEYKLVA